MEIIIEMQLLFKCPVQNQDFFTASWIVSGRLKQVESLSGQKSLHGRIEAHCPFCEEAHGFSPDELACPFGNSTHI